MTQRIINTGVADKGNGDPLRTAFTKVNDNFTELYNQVAASVVVDATPPETPGEGDLWWDPEGGRLYISYDSNWIDASPVDGAGISSTNQLVNGAHTVSLASNGTVTFPNDLTVANGVIGMASSVTVTEETTDGTISQTTTTESQIEIDDESIVIAKRATQVTDDTVVVTTDEAGSSVTVNNSGVFIKKYAEPDGPNNTSYFQVRTNNGAILEAVEENVADETYGRVIAAQGVVEIATRADGVEKNWGFSYDGTMVVPTNSTILGTNDLTIRSESDGNSGLFLNSSPLVGTAVLYATNNAIITADYDGNRKDWNFDKSGTITVPLLLPKIFTAVLDEEHMVVPITLEGDPWQYGVEFAVNPDGSVQTQMDDPNPTVDPGYVQGSVFRFTEADHGIPGYTFDITLNFTFDEEAEVFVTNPSVTAPPEYPATVESLGAIKLSATGSTVVPGQQIIASDAQGGITNEYITVWVEGGGTNYPEIVAVQPGWTVVGEGLNYADVIDVELITQFPGSVIYRITTEISSAKMGYEYTFIEPDSSEPDLQNWVFGTDGQLTVPGAIFRDGGLYMNSSGSTTAASVFVSGNSGDVILRTADNAEQISYDLTLDVNGETSFPGRLNFSDGSTLGDNILTGAVDSDLGLEVKRIITVSDVAAAGSTTGTLIVDISENDDITVVAPGWEINAGSEIAPQWMMVTVIAFNPDNTAIEITVDGFVFEPGNTYTFRNPVPESNIWVIRSQTGGILGPGGAVITNETAPLGGGGTYRELTIELPTPDELNEHRWVFDNDGDFTTPGNITVTGGLLTTYGAVVDVAVNTDNYLGLHANPNAGVLVRSSDTELNYSDWRFEVGGALTLPQYGWIQGASSNARVELNAVGTNESNLSLTTYVDGEMLTSSIDITPAIGINLNSVRRIDITAGWDSATAKWDNWQAAEQTWVDIRNQDATDIAPGTRTWAGLPSYEAYPLLMDFVQNIPQGEIPPPSSMAPAANTAKAAYELWQAEQAAINVTIRAKDKAWTFGNNGSLTLPNTAILDTSDSNIEFRGMNNFNVESLVGVNIISDSQGAGHSWTFEDNGSLTLPNGTISPATDTLRITAATYDIIGGGYGYDLEIKGGAGLGSGNNGIGGDVNIIGGSGDDAGSINITSGVNTWTFANDGNLTFPDATVQTTAYAPVSGSWTVTAGTNNYSFEVPLNGTYTMWVRANIPNGIIVWNATVTVTNSNVPAIGTHYAWNYTGAGTPIALTALPNQIEGTAGSIHVSTYAGTTANTFTFGISNTSGGDVTVYYGYTKI